MTTLPEPTFLRPVYRVFTADQMSEYGAAEYARAIEDAANVCHAMVYESDDEALRQDQCAWNIRKLGAAS